MSGVQGQRPWPVLVSALSVAVCLAILICLGVWQLRRLQWKEGILADIALSERSSPVALTPDASPYRKVFATGLLRYDLAVRYGAEVQDLRNGGTMIGAQAIVPLIRPDGPPVLVDLGWLPDGGRPTGPAEPTVVTGYVRPAERPGWFSAADDVAGRRFYTMDPAALGAALGLPAVAPVVLVALGPPAGGLIPADHLPQPPNNHLSYAFTWFGLAGGLLVIAALKAWKAVRR